MIEELKEFYKYRGTALMMITYRDIKVRYKQSVMGFMWAVLMPVLIVMSGVVIRYAYALATHAPLKTADISSRCSQVASLGISGFEYPFFLLQPDQQLDPRHQDLLSQRNLSRCGGIRQPLRLSRRLGSADCPLGRSCE